MPITVKPKDSRAMRSHDSLPRAPALAILNKIGAQTKIQHNVRNDW